MSLIVDEHRQYLSDTVRLRAFERALRHYIGPETIVADLGSGTGILGLLACRAGAARVYAIEQSGMAGIARALAAANGLSDRFHVIEGHSTEIGLPERADLIVGDFLGQWGFTAGIFEVYPPAAASLLKPGGVLIPSEVGMWIAPVESESMNAVVRFWETPRGGIAVAPVMEWAVNTGYPVRFDGGDLLGQSVEIARAATSAVPATGFSASVDSLVTRDGTLHGLAGWFSATLAPGVALTNEPGAPERVGKRNVFLPVRTPVAVAPGDRVQARLRILPNELIVNWTVSVAGTDGSQRMRCSHSTIHGMLLTRDDLRRGEPSYVPVLTARGRARRTVFELCDGRRSLADVERIVYERHPEVLGSPSAAAAFVAEVIAGYAQ